MPNETPVPDQLAHFNHAPQSTPDVPQGHTSVDSAPAQPDAGGNPGHAGAGSPERLTMPRTYDTTGLRVIRKGHTVRSYAGAVGTVKKANPGGVFVEWTDKRVTNETPRQLEVVRKSVKNCTDVI